jgi:hypothetical protein
VRSTSKEILTIKSKDVGILHVGGGFYPGDTYGTFKKVEFDPKENIGGPYNSF